MSMITPLDTSLYSELIGRLQPASLSPITPYANQQNQEEETVAKEPVDLRTYYKNFESGDLLSQVGDYVADAQGRFDEAMVSAIEHGMTVQDACNIHAAKAAYKASCNVLTMTAALSTFALDV